MPTRCNRWFLLQILLLAQHVSGTIMPIIRNSRVLYGWSLPVVFGALVFKFVGMVWSWGLCVRFAGCFIILELLMMGIMVPETCWASNKICNKYHLLHLVGILFPHISTCHFKFWKVRHSDVSYHFPNTVSVLLQDFPSPDESSVPG